MARPIRETPILTGEDAAHFVTEMQKVDNLSAEQKSRNQQQFLNDVRIALDTISICI